MSDHIPDLTKMIGETPRTDAARPPYTELQEFVSAEFARTLERELNVANKTIRLQHELIATAEKRGVDKAKEELNAANERISKLYDYVAALETGGDLMAHELGFGYDVDLWNKARGESKP